jgi:hypothetical protein
MCRGSTRLYVHCLDFQYNNFYMPFLLSKNGLCMWIPAYFLAENDFFLNVPHLLWVWDFGGMYLTHLETRIWRGTRKWLLWPSKLCCPLRVQGKKTFLSTLNVMILQIVRNECIRFGGHICDLTKCGQITYFWTFCDHDEGISWSRRPTKILKIGKLKI